MNKAKSQLILLADCICYIIALAAGTYLRFGADNAAGIFFYYSGGFYGLVLILSTISYIALYIYFHGKGEYKLGRDLIDQFEQVFRNHCLVFVALIVILFAFQAGELLSRRLIFYTFIISFCLDLVVREMIRHILQKRYENNVKTLTIAGRIVKVLKDDESLGIDDNVMHVFAIGCKGIPAEYGGFESFMHNLTGNRQDTNILYHVARIAEDDLRFEFHNAAVFDVHVPSIGAAGAVYFDLAALDKSIAYCRKNKVKNPVFFIMACRIGPFIAAYKRKIKAMGGTLLVNPDGHEWKRQKWNRFIRAYWKASERLMVKSADRLICDSKNIEKYIREEYKAFSPVTSYISYGAKPVEADDERSARVDEEFFNWIRYNRVVPGGYYLIVGRFVPENNFETMIREFMHSKTKRDLVVITTENDKLLGELEKKLRFSSDKRVKFTGTVYDTGLLTEIRKNAYGYIHGHSVGGTNPSLLESLASTNVNLLFDVGFNSEVGGDAALYWKLDAGSLSKLIEKTDALSDDERAQMGEKAKQRIRDNYLWEKIVKDYESVFKGGAV